MIIDTEKKRKLWFLLIFCLAFICWFCARGQTTKISALPVATTGLNGSWVLVCNSNNLGNQTTFAVPLSVLSNSIVSGLQNLLTSTNVLVTTNFGHAADNQTWFLAGYGTDPKLGTPNCTFYVNDDNTNTLWQCGDPITGICYINDEVCLGASLGYFKTGSIPVGHWNGSSSCPDTTLGGAYYGFSFIATANGFGFNTALVSPVTTNLTEGININSPSFTYGAIALTNHQILNGPATYVDFNGAFTLYDENGHSAILVGNRNLNDISGNTTVDWGSGDLYWNGQLIVDWQNQVLNEISGENILNWANGLLIDPASGTSLDWPNRQTKDSANVLSLDWNLRQGYDGSGSESIDWNLRKLVGNWSFTVAPIIFDSAALSSFSNGQLVTSSTGFSSNPSLVHWVLHCDTTDATTGFSAGDEVELSAVYTMTTAVPAFTTGSTASTIFFTVNTIANTTVQRKGNTGGASVTLADWHIRCYYNQ